MPDGYLPEYERKRLQNETLLSGLIPVLEEAGALAPVARARINYADDDPGFGIALMEYETGNRDYVFIGDTEGIAMIWRFVGAVRYKGTYWNRVPDEYK